MAYELRPHRRDDRTKTPTPELPALPDALQERHEVPRDLGLLVLEADCALAVVRLDAVVAEAGVVPALDDHGAPRRERAAVPPLDEAGLRRLLCGRGDVCAGVVVFPQYADPV